MDLLQVYVDSEIATTGVNLDAFKQICKVLNDRVIESITTKLNDKSNYHHWSFKFCVEHVPIVAAHLIREKIIDTTMSWGSVAVDECLFVNPTSAFEEVNRDKHKRKSGVYLVQDKKGRIVRVGKAMDLVKRKRQHERNAQFNPTECQIYLYFPFNDSDNTAHRRGLYRDLCYRVLFEFKNICDIETRFSPGLFNLFDFRRFPQNRQSNPNDKCDILSYLIEIVGVACASPVHCLNRRAGCEKYFQGNP